jgi:ParB family chromosome partitioning protein
MAKNSDFNLNLPSLDDLFTTQAEREDAKLEKVVLLPPEEISEYPNHPFQVRMDNAMKEMVQSVRENGVLVPSLVRPKEGCSYEMVSGHRRKRAAELAGLKVIPCIVRDLTDDQAIVIMVDSNLQREQILPSEKAFAYKMKLDATRRIAGRPSKENSATLLQNFNGKTSRELIAEQSGESHEQIRKYIRLTNLISELLSLVDNFVLKEPGEPQMALRPAVELSYLRKEEQLDLFDLIEEMDATPSHAQALKLRRLSERKEPGERLARDVIVSVMQEEKPNQVEQFKMPKERISKFFPAGTPAKKMEEIIIKALELYRRRQRDRER